MSSQHVLVYWEEEGLTSIVKSSQVVEPSNPQKGAKAQIKWGQKNTACNNCRNWMSREIEVAKAQIKWGQRNTACNNCKNWMSLGIEVEGSRVP